MVEVLKKCFATNLNEYNNIGIDFEINKFLVWVSAATMVGIIFLNLYRRNIKLLVSRLFMHKAKSEETAKTLSELGLAESRGIKRMLTGENLLTKIVGRVGESKYSYEEYKALPKKEKVKRTSIDFSSAGFYVRNEHFLLGESVCFKYSTSIVRTVVECVFVVMICTCLIACMPGILNVINNLLK